MHGLARRVCLGELGLCRRIVSTQKGGMQAGKGSTQNNASSLLCPDSEAPTPWLSVYFRAKISRSSLLNCDLESEKNSEKTGPPPDLVAVTWLFGSPT